MRKSISDRRLCCVWPVMNDGEWMADELEGLAWFVMELRQWKDQHMEVVMANHLFGRFSCGLSSLK